MSRVPFGAVLIAAVVGAAGGVSAQEWTEFVSARDGFRVNFPGQPTVLETTYTSEFGYALPARIFSAERGRERYRMTVVDYSGIEAMGKARIKACTPGDERCLGSMNTGEGYWKLDLGGAIVYAVWGFLRRGVTLTHMHWSWNDLVEGQSLQFSSGAEKAQSFVHISLHTNRLYILEATVPAGAPPPGLFQQSMGYVDKDGVSIRYQSVYNNRFPAPPRIPANTGVDPPLSGTGGGR
jgi:hypothetical protein